MRPAAGAARTSRLPRSGCCSACLQAATASVWTELAMHLPGGPCDKVTIRWHFSCWPPCRACMEARTIPRRIGSRTWLAKEDVVGIAAPQQVGARQPVAIAEHQVEEEQPAQSLASRQELRRLRGCTAQRQAGGQTHHASICQCRSVTCWSPRPGGAPLDRGRYGRHAVVRGVRACVRCFHDLR